jgi:hypothetical protein
MADTDTEPDHQTRAPIRLPGFASGDADPRNRPLPDQPWEPEETRQYLIEFTGSLGRDERREFQIEYGLRLDTYIPTNTYLESIDEAAFEGLPRHRLVASIFPFEPIYKIAPGLGQNQANWRSAARRAMTDLILRADLDPDAIPAEAAEELRKLGATEVTVLDDRARGGYSRIEFVVAPQLVPAVAALEDVRWIEEVPDLKSDAGIPLDFLETGRPKLTPYADTGLRGKDQVVGVIDQGSIERDHCWFQHAIGVTGTPGPLHRKIREYLDLDLLAGVNIKTHPTFVAGVLAGDDVNSPGGAPIRGIACEARIAFGNRNDFQRGSTYNKTFFEYLDELKKVDGFIVNTSWHDVIFPGGVEYTGYAVDVDKFMWENEDCLVVASSGNSTDTPGPPGSAKNPLGVSAAYVDMNGSCFGDGVGQATSDGRRKPDLLAPGCAIDSAKEITPPQNVANQPDACATVADATAFAPQVNPNPPCAGGAAVYCATSFATPVVAAAAAVVRQYFTEGWYPTGKKVRGNRRRPSGALLKATLLTATQRTGTTGDGAPYPRPNEGWGVLQLDRILRLVAETRKLRVSDVRKSIGLFTGDCRTHHFRVKTANRRLKVTLAWTEPPAPVSSPAPVLNDLDLAVIAPDGTTTYLGNHFPVAAEESATGGAHDRLNNVEMVYLKNAPHGRWTVNVCAHHVVQTDTGQGYALVVRGALE